MNTIKNPTAHTSVDIPQEAFDWYDEYAHGDISRRTFIKRLGTLGVASLTLGTLTSALTPNYALAEQVSFNDPEIKATYETFESPTGHGEGRGYLVQPVRDTNNATHKTPGILVVHENRGLNPYIKDVARRAAKAGFVAFAPDALHPAGGYPGNDDEGRTLQRGLDRAKIEQDFIAAVGFLKTQSHVNNIGAVGFCFGGYIVNMLAAQPNKLIQAGVPYYGTPAAKALWPNISAPLLVQLAEHDKRVNATWPDYEAALKSQKSQYEMHMYSDSQHGFHNDSTGRYNPEAAELSWQRTLEHFTKHLA